PIPQSFAAGNTGIVLAYDLQSSPVLFKVGGEELDANVSLASVYLYDVRYWNPNASAWANWCEPDPSGLTQAIPLEGSCDGPGRHINIPSVTPCACSAGVLANCVRWGYPPWAALAGRSLRDLHQACTRMARADYCGNGKSHTRDGTPIRLQDRIG